MVETTPKQIIYDAYRDLGVLRPGQMVSADSLDDGLRRMNELIDSWSLERLMIYQIRRDVHVLTGSSPWTLGPTGTIQGERPQRIDGAGLLYSGSTGASTGIESAIPVLTLDRARGQQSGVYIDNAYPNRNVTLYPPVQNGQSLVLYTWQTLSQFDDGLEWSYCLPAGYRVAVKWGLACQLIPAAAIQAKIPQPRIDYIMQEAGRTKGVIKSFNMPILEMNCDPALTCGGAYNIQTDGY